MREAKEAEKDVMDKYLALFKQHTTADERLRAHNERILELQEENARLQQVWTPQLAIYTYMMYVCICVCVHIYINIYEYVLHRYIYTYTYTYIYIYIYICVHIHIHT